MLELSLGSWPLMLQSYPAQNNYSRYLPIKYKKVEITHFQLISTGSENQQAILITRMNKSV